jgi:hypothetical protein
MNLNTIRDIVFINSTKVFTYNNELIVEVKRSVHILEVKSDLKYKLNDPSIRVSLCSL